METKKEEEHELRERLQGLKSQDDFYTVGSVQKNSKVFFYFFAVAGQGGGEAGAQKEASWME